jgi:hypothetical protein
MAAATAARASLDLIATERYLRGGSISKPGPTIGDVWYSFGAEG